MNVSMFLFRAADLIDERGWWSGGGDNEYGYKSLTSVCALQAIDAAAAEATGKDRISRCGDPPPGAIAYLERYLEFPERNGKKHPIAIWNDASTKEHVTATLRAAALIAAASEDSDETAPRQIPASTCLSA